MPNITANRAITHTNFPRLKVGNQITGTVDSLLMDTSIRQTPA